MIKLNIFILSVSCYLFHCNFGLYENKKFTFGDMVKINAAGKSFQMGSINGYNNEKPVHTVKFTYDFYIGKTEVTQKNYRILMGVNPSKFLGDNLPVEQVTWYDAVLYCNALSKMLGFDTIYQYGSIKGMPGDSCELTDLKINLDKKGYRLPTEAEWEYSCRGGTTTEYFWGDDSTYINKYAWYRKNSYEKTHPIGQKMQNGFGLYDMCGNVFEWCQDWWYETYPEGIVVDPAGVEIGLDRVLRGGSWINSAEYCRSTDRNRFAPSVCYNNVGFRLVFVP